MSTDKEKSETGGGDSPVLFGPTNDPRLSDTIDALTGKALDGVIARLEAFSDDVFGEDEDEDPFPNGIKADTPAVAAQAEAQEPDLSGPDDGGEDGLDRILDKLSDTPTEEGSPDEAEAPVTSEAEPEGIRSLQDLAQMQEAEAPAPAPQRSPIADVLAVSVAADEEDAEADYLDTGLPDPGDDGSEEALAGDAGYDPLGDLDIFAEYEDGPAADLTEEPDPDFPDEDPDPDFPDEDLDPDFADEDIAELSDETGEGDDGARSERSYALPEPSPYGDQDMMGGAYGYDEDEPEPLRDEAELETAEDMLEDWPMPEEKVSEQADQQAAEPVAPVSWSDEAEAGATRSDGSDLDDLISGLSGGSEDPQARPDEADMAPEAPQARHVPAFLRRDETGRPLIGVNSADPKAPDEEPQDLPEDMDEEAPMSETDEISDEADMGVQEAVTAQPARSGRKRMLAGVAALALLAAAGFGAYTMMPGLMGQPRADVVPAPAPALAPLPDMAQAEPEGEVIPEEGILTPPAFEVTELEPPADPMDVIAPVADDQAPVPAEVSDLLAELSREPEAPAPVGVSAEELEVLETRIGEMEQARSEAEARASELTNELTSLTDQITGLLQRDGEQAERLERMERLIRGQSAIMAQFGQMEESLEQTQVVLLDVSARIGAVEGQNPADRDAVNRALADVEGRIQALTANMSILARMSIEGVDALRAPNASSGTVGVQTSPAASAPSGGTDTVFQSETGGFRITSDPAGRIGSDVEKDDFVEGYGYVLDVLPASDGQRLVIMENGSVLIPSGD